jgi:hypothetical protein
MGQSPNMSGTQPPIHIPRPSACADAALRAELARVERMTVEERAMAALTMRERFDWLQPEAGKLIGKER